MIFKEFFDIKLKLWLDFSISRSVTDSRNFPPTSQSLHRRTHFIVEFDSIQVASFAYFLCNKICYWKTNSALMIGCNLHIYFTMAHMSLKQFLFLQRSTNRGFKFEKRYRYTQNSSRAFFSPSVCSRREYSFSSLCENYTKTISRSIIVVQWLGFQRWWEVQLFLVQIASNCVSLVAFTRFICMHLNSTSSLKALQANLKLILVDFSSSPSLNVFLIEAPYSNSCLSCKHVFTSLSIHKAS